MAAAELQPWTLVEKVVCWEIWQADMARVVLRIDKPPRLDEQPQVEAEARAIAAAPEALRALAAFVRVVKTDALLMLDPDLGAALEPAEQLMTKVCGEPVHGRRNP